MTEKTNKWEEEFDKFWETEASHLKTASKKWIKSLLKQEKKKWLEVLPEEKEIEEPNQYHHLCYGGSTVSLVDVFDGNENYTCRYKGYKSWAQPACENCDGNCIGIKKYTEYQGKDNAIKKSWNDCLQTIKQQLTK